MTLSSNVLTDSYNQFSLDLYHQASANTNGNVFLCTFSILSALSMCLPGARQNTEAQLKKIMHFDGVANDAVYNSNLEMLNYFDTKTLKGNVLFNMANKIYPKTDFSLKAEFTNILSTYYKTDIQSLNFGNEPLARQTINGWVEQQTANKIKNLIPEGALNAATRLVLVNAIYFKGGWMSKFEAKLTRKRDFASIDGSNKQVDMMFQSGKFKLLQNPNGLKASIIELPYNGEQISMSIILPDRGVQIREVEAQLKNANVLKNVLESNKFKIKVELYVPKFNLEETFELSSTLAKMGAPDAFDGRIANFSGMSDEVNSNNNLYISNVIHKAIVEVTEEGTVAAGATAIIVAITTAVLPPTFPVEFKCDRPFLFVLHDSLKKNILFIGKYAKP